MFFLSRHNKQTLKRRVNLETERHEAIKQEEISKKSQHLRFSWRSSISTTQPVHLIVWIWIFNKWYDFRTRKMHCKVKRRRQYGQTKVTMILWSCNTYTNGVRCWSDHYAAFDLSWSLGKVPQAAQWKLRNSFRIHSESEVLTYGKRFGCRK